jgi:hypothetical protein
MTVRNLELPLPSQVGRRGRRPAEQGCYADVVLRNLAAGGFKPAR